MGVIYKLKEEVVNFVIDQKKVNPKISCRKLVEVVEKQFQIKVSKSSINSVIKIAQLSSPIGRPPLYDIEKKPHPKLLKKPAKFRIPFDKKKELFGDKIQEVNKKEKKADTSEQKSPLEIKRELIEQFLPCGVEKSNIFQEMSKEDLVIISHGDENTEKETALLGTSPSSRGILYDGMGNIFLKAAEWDLCGGSFLGKLLQRHMEGNLLNNIDEACEVLLFFELFGIKRIEDIGKYQKTGLWKLNGIDGKLEYTHLLKMIEGIKDVRKLFIDMANELPQVFSEVNYFKLFLEDNTTLCIDAQLNTAWDNNVQSEFSIPLFKATSILSKCFINNVQSIIISSAPSLTTISPSFYNLITCFENLAGKRLTKIALLGTDQEQITEYTMPPKRKYFIIGLWPWQQGFSRFIKSTIVRELESYYYEPKNQKFFFREMCADIEIEELGQVNVPLRIIVIYDQKQRNPIVAIITNQFKLSTAEIINAYMMRQPNLQNGHWIRTIKRDQEHLLRNCSSQFESVSVESFVSVKSVSIWDCFYLFLSCLNEYCKKHFFPAHYNKFDISLIKSIAYRLPGYYYEHAGYTNVSLVLSKSEHTYKQDLSYAVTRLNEQDIKDTQGRVLILSLLYL